MQLIKDCIHHYICPSVLITDLLQSYINYYICITYKYSIQICMCKGTEIIRNARWTAQMRVGPHKCALDRTNANNSDQQTRTACIEP